MTLVTLVMVGSLSINLVTFVISGTVKVHRSHVRISSEVQVNTVLPLGAGNHLFVCK